MRRAACLPSLCKIMDHTHMYARACTHTGCLRAFIHPLLSIPPPNHFWMPSPCMCSLPFCPAQRSPVQRFSFWRYRVCFPDCSGFILVPLQKWPYALWMVLVKNGAEKSLVLIQGERCLLWILLLCFPANYMYFIQFWLSSKRNQSLASLTMCSVTLCVPSRLKPYCTNHGIYFLLLFLCSTED